MLHNKTLLIIIIIITIALSCETILCRPSRSLSKDDEDLNIDLTCNFDEDQIDSASLNWIKYFATILNVNKECFLITNSSKIDWFTFFERVDHRKHLNNAQMSKFINNYYELYPSENLHKSNRLKHNLKASNASLIINTQTEIEGHFFLCKKPEKIEDFFFINKEERCEMPQIDNNGPIIDEDYMNQLKSTKMVAISKLTNSVEGTGYECKKERIIVESFKNFFQALSSSKRVESINMSPEECHNMATTFSCEGHQLICNTDYCEYDGTPEPRASWLSSSIEIGYKCTFKSRLISAKSTTDTLFKRNCTSLDLSCRTDDSIIVWKESIYQTCPYHVVKYLNNATIDQNVIVDLKSNLAFQIIKQVTICHTKMYETTQGLYLSSDPEALAFGSRALDINDVLRLKNAEFDAHKYHDYIEFLHIKNRFCESFKDKLRDLKYKQDEYEVLTDNDGKKIPIYMNYDLILVPKCSVIQNIRIDRVNNNCYKDVLVHHGQNYSALLTKSLVLRDDFESADLLHEADCHKPTYRFFSETNQLLNRSDHLMLSTLSNKVKLFDHSINFISLQRDQYVVNSPIDKMSQSMFVNAPTGRTIPYKNIYMQNERTELNDTSAIRFIYNFMRSIFGGIWSFLVDIKNFFKFSIFFLGFVLVGIVFYKFYGPKVINKSGQVYRENRDLFSAMQMSSV